MPLDAMTSRHRFARSLSLGAAAIVVAASGVMLQSLSARAQAPARIVATLEAFTPWIGPTGAIQARLRVQNTGEEAATNIRVGLTIHEGVTTRTGLERTFDGRLGPTEAADTINVEGEIAPGDARRVSIEVPLQDFRFFTTALDRTYPVRLTVRSDETAAAPVDTHLIFFREPAITPLRLMMVLPLDIPTPYQPDLRFDGAGLKRVLDGGTLNQILDSLDRTPTATVTLAPDGLTLDTLSDLADGYRISSDRGDGGRRFGRESAVATESADLLGRIKSAVERSRIGLLAVPYSQPNLVWLVDHDLGERAQEQVEKGRDALAERLDEKPLAGWLLPTSGAMDEPTLREVSRLGVSKVVVQSSSLVIPSTPLTRSAPALISGRSGEEFDALVTDAGLQERLVAREGISEVQGLQRLLAETATIMLERPSEPRVVAIAAPPSWNPGRTYISGLISAVAGSPWMRGVLPDAALTPADPETEAPSGAEHVDLASADQVLSAVGPAPPSSFASGIASAATFIDYFSQIDPPPQIVSSFEKRLMIAESSEWWAPGGVAENADDFLSVVRQSVGSEFAKINPPPDRQTITLTSRNGVIPLVLETATDYPVKVAVRLVSDKLRLPQGNRIEVELEPPARTIELQAVAEASGTFPLRVILEVPDGDRILDESTLQVRSTAYNRVALWITGGAGVFLVGWWIAGFSRRRLRP